MIVRLFALASLFFALNLADTLGLPHANMIEKALFLALAAAVMVLRRMDRWALALMAFTVLITALFGALTPYPGFSWLTWLLSINQIVILFALTGFYPTERDAIGILRISAWLPLISVGAGLAAWLASGRAVFGVEFATGTWRLQGALIPAFLSGIAMTGLVAALMAALEWRRLPYLALVAVNLAILLMAGGRTALAVAVFVSAALIAFSPLIHRRDKLTLLTGAVMAAPLFAILALPFALRRLSTSTDNGRAAMADYLYDLAAQYPWTGIGFGHQFWHVPPDVVARVGSAAAHNDYLRLTVELGVLGMVVVFLALAIALLRAALRGGRVNGTALAGSAGFLLLCVSDNALATPAYFPLLIVTMLCAPPYREDAPFSNKGLAA